MSNKKEVVSIATKHIDAGILKYQAEPDTRLNSLIKSAGLNYTSYTFNDGRILLVLPDKIGAFLYADKETVFKVLDLKT